MFLECEQEQAQESPLEEVPTNLHHARKYIMLPARLVIFVLAVLINILLVLMGHSWRDEWEQMNVRGYLLEGDNWNRFGF